MRLINLSRVLYEDLVYVLEYFGLINGMKTLLTTLFTITTFICAFITAHAGIFHRIRESIFFNFDMIVF